MELEWKNKMKWNETAPATLIPNTVVDSGRYLVNENAEWMRIDERWNGAGVRRSFSSRLYHFAIRSLISRNEGTFRGFYDPRPIVIR